MQPDQDMLKIDYSGEKGPLFGLAFKTGLLTLVTLGIYRFWQKTRIRKYIWSSVSADGDAFEYTGTGLEKFLGFLIAIIFLAVYIGLIQIVLFYAGLNVMVNPETASPQEILLQSIAIYITFFAILPFILYATYRARRYRMARTRWRGIRFGMEKGAWGYVARALGYGLLTAITLGILTPLQSFKLEKYMADRSYFGTARFHQHGKWTDLYPAMMHVFIGLGLLLAGGGLIAFGAMNSDALAAVGGLLLFVGYIWIIIGAVIYSVRSFGYLSSHKVLGDAIRFEAKPRAGEVIKTYILGGLLLSILASVAFGIVIALASAFIPFLQNGDNMSAMIVIGAIGAIGYLVALVLVQALSLILITQPILAHYVQTIVVLNAGELNRIAQREAETGVDAEGFADALDVGGAI